MKKLMVVLLVVALFVLVVMPAMAGHKKTQPKIAGMTVKEATKVLLHAGFSDAVIPIVAQMPSNQAELSGLTLIISTNRDTLTRKTAAGDTGMTMAYAADPVRSGLVEMMVDFHPELGFFPRTR